MANFPQADWNRLVAALLFNCRYLAEGHAGCEEVTAAERALCPSHQVLADEHALFRLLVERGKVELLEVAEHDLVRWDQLQAIRTAEAKLTPPRERRTRRPEYTG